MPRYVIERNIPGAGTLSESELHDISAKSNEVLASMAPRAQWSHSYVTDDKIYCVYLAENEDVIKKHAEISGFPASKITPIRRIFDPTTEKS